MRDATAGDQRACREDRVVAGMRVPSLPPDRGEIASSLLWETGGVWLQIGCNPRITSVPGNSLRRGYPQVRPASVRAVLLKRKE